MSSARICRCYREQIMWRWGVVKKKKLCGGGGGVKKLCIDGEGGLPAKNRVN